MDLDVELIREKILCSGRRVVLAERVYRYKDTTFVKDVVKFGEAVAIVPLKDDGNIILIRQFRAPLNKWILEVPAGKVEADERPEEAARRESIEEIGYTIGELVKLASIYMSPGYSNEILHIFLARELNYVGRKPLHGELIEAVEMKLDRALNRILGGEVADSKTLVAILLTKRYLQTHH